MSLVYIIEDEPVLADVLTGIVEAIPGQPQVETFDNAVAAMAAVNEQLPDAILLDVLLVGPDGFAFLNELASYLDTARIPVVLMSSLDFSGQDLSPYGVVAVLDKATMTPETIQEALQQALPPVVIEPEIVTAEEVPPTVPQPPASASSASATPASSAPAAPELPPVELPPVGDSYAG